MGDGRASRAGAKLAASGRVSSIRFKKLGRCWLTWIVENVLNDVGLGQDWQCETWVKAALQASPIEIQTFIIEPVRAASTSSVTRRPEIDHPVCQRPVPHATAPIGRIDTIA